MTEITAYWRITFRPIKHWRETRVSQSWHRRTALCDPNEDWDRHHLAVLIGPIAVTVVTQLITEEHDWDFWEARPEPRGPTAAEVDADLERRGIEAQRRREKLIDRARWDRYGRMLAAARGGQ